MDFETTVSWKCSKALFALFYLFNVKVLDSDRQHMTKLNSLVSKFLLFSGFPCLMKMPEEMKAHLSK